FDIVRAGGRDVPQVLRRRSIDHQLGAVERNALFVRGPERRRHVLAGEEPAILVAFIDRLRNVRLVRPDDRGVAVRREQVGKRGSPSARPDYRAAQQACLAEISTANTMTIAIASVAAGRFAAVAVPVPCFPNRCSSPLRSRTMFARWVQKTNNAMTTLTMKIGERRPTVIASRMGRIVAL